jgi:glucose-6-phosphate isomerase
LFDDGQIGVSVRNITLSPKPKLEDAIKALLQSSSSSSYIAIHGYLDRSRDGSLQRLRDLVAKSSGRPTTFGWGPRFLHSTGQYHKGGPAQGVFLQLISEEAELNVPGRDFGFLELMNSQAAGDANVLSEKGRPVLSLRFKDQGKALSLMLQILEAM